MGPTERKQLFENIVRLRRAEREAPDNRELVAVRTDLERALGETVSRSLAAQLLGVSHTALNRWIAAGDVPIVVTREGRRAVPVAALVDLYEAVERERTSGRRRRHTLEPVMVEGRNRADKIRPRELVSEEAGEESDARRATELRNLAYHRALARRLRRPIADDALHLVWQWRDTGKIDPRYAEAWEEVLRKPIPEIRKVLRDDSQLARDLRQNSPFAGLLSEPERLKILTEIR
jgi:hypothetical protein